MRDHRTVVSTTTAIFITTTISRVATAITAALLFAMTLLLGPTLAVAQSAPPSWDSFYIQGTVFQAYASGDSPVTYAAVEVTLPNSDIVRVECGTTSTAVAKSGCLSLASGDFVAIYGRLSGYISCRHDGLDSQAITNLVYRRNPNQSWSLLTTP